MLPSVLEADAGLSRPEKGFGYEVVDVSLDLLAFVGQKDFAVAHGCFLRPDEAISPCALPAYDASYAASVAYFVGPAANRFPDFHPQNYTKESAE